MKQLRILTGRHAGTRIRLVHPQCTLGADDDTDVQISGWKQPTITLSIEEGSNVVQWAPTAGTQATAALEDFVPRCFGDVVLCVGPLSNNGWPSDVQLLKRLLEQPKPTSAAPGRRPSRLMTLGGGASALLLAAFASVVVQHTREAQAHETQVPLTQQVTLALQRAGMAGLEVDAKDGAHATISGLVPGQAALQRIQALAKGFPAGAVVTRVSTADDVSRAISDALQITSVRVDYRGAGVFAVSGEAPDAKTLSASVQRIAHDIGPAVKRIDVAVKEAPAAETAHLDAMLVTPELQYVQTRDGTKHLIVSSPAGASWPVVE